MVVQDEREWLLQAALEYAPRHEARLVNADDQIWQLKIDELGAVTLDHLDDKAAQLVVRTIHPARRPNSPSVAPPTPQPIIIRYDGTHLDALNAAAERAIDYLLRAAPPEVRNA